jgi:hypothetical protein
MALKIFGFSLGKEEQVKDEIVAGETSYSQLSLHVSSSFANQQLIVDDNMMKSFGHVPIYREMALSAEIDFAVDEIVNSIVATDSEDDILEVEIDHNAFGKSQLIQNKILKEWKYLYNVMDISTQMQEWIRNWYIDGLLYLYLVYDKNKKSIVGCIQLESTKIKHVIEDSGEEYYIYITDNKKQSSFGIYQEKLNGYKILKDSIIFIDSGIYRYISGNNIPVSMLHKAIKPFNQLKLLEDSSVVYRVVRAPEKRAFYIGVGDMPDHKARGYIAEIQQSYRKKMTYNSASGTFSTQNDLQTMMEDYWLPRRDDGKNTEIQVLPGASNVADVTDIEYFKQKLYRSLNIPMSRFVSESTAASVFGRSSETNREEIKFDSFINKLRTRLNVVFHQALMSQCVLSGICTKEEYKESQYFIRFKYNKIGYFSELKKMEIWNERFNMVSTISGIKENFIPDMWIYREVMNLTDQEIVEIKTMLKQQQEELASASGENSDDGGGEEPMGDEQPSDEASGDFFDTSAFGDEAAQEDGQESSGISAMIKDIMSLKDIPDDEKSDFISNLISIKTKSSDSKKSKSKIASLINKSSSSLSDETVKTISDLIR